MNPEASDPSREIWAPTLDLPLSLDSRGTKNCSRFFSLFSFIPVVKKRVTTFEVFTSWS